jgi:signal peptidase II
MSTGMAPAPEGPGQHGSPRSQRAEPFVAGEQTGEGESQKALRDNRPNSTIGRSLAPEVTSASVPFHRQLLFWSIALGGAAFDLVTKTAVFDAIGPPGSPPRPVVANILELHTSFNKGALWGFARGVNHSSEIFALLSIVAALGILWYLFVRKAAVNAALTAALALIMAGALGNCYDRLMLGHVRDFVHFHVDSIGFDFPIFNFADNMLVIGAAILMVLALRPEPLVAPEPALPDSTAPTPVGEASQTS